MKNRSKGPGKSGMGARFVEREVGRWVVGGGGVGGWRGGPNRGQDGSGRSASRTHLGHLVNKYSPRRT